ncbi:MAG TPA: hypothetical protein EYP21_05385 [Syntrophaceae bacterium]|nr:hypothetical protein [Syntrophaceae bacterium]
MKSRVLFSKVDMDTCLTAFILRVNPGDHVIAIQEDADQRYLNNPNVICIECGGSGKAHLNNFDHHNFEGKIGTACEQAYEKMGIKDDALKKLVDYVSIIDINPRSLPVKDFPNLSCIFSGMLLTYNDPKKQLFKGIEIFSLVLKKGLDPFDTMPHLAEWAEYIEAKRENDLEVEKAKAFTSFVTSKSGLKIGYIETSIFGVLGALYDQGCNIAIAYNPNFGNPAIRKFTIAGNGISVNHLTSILNRLEPGWGGRGTIIGSPRNGSKLSLEEVVEIVRRNV